MCLYSLGRDSGDGVENMLEKYTSSRRKFSTNMMVIVLCTSPDSMREPLRKSGATKHMARISGVMSRSGDRTVKQGARERT